MSAIGVARMLVMSVSVVGLMVSAVAFARNLGQADQVASGADAFARECARCHGEQAEGGIGSALDQPTLATYRTVTGLSRFVRLSMPDDSPGSLDDQTYFDAIAFLLDLNGMNPDGVPIDSSTDLALTN